MKLIQNILLIPIILFAENCYSQIKSISEKPNRTELIENDTSSNYIIGEEGTFSLKYQSFGDYPIYWNEDENSFDWECIIEKSVRLKLSNKLETEKLIKINSKEGKLKNINATIYYMENKELITKKLNKKNWNTFKQGDTTYYSLSITEPSFPLIIDYSLSVKFVVPKMFDKNTDLYWDFNEGTFRKGYSKVNFVIPEYFQYQTVFTGINPNEIKSSDDIQLENLYIEKLQKEGEQTTFEKINMTYTKKILHITLKILNQPMTLVI